VEKKKSTSTEHFQCLFPRNEKETLSLFAPCFRGCLEGKKGEKAEGEKKIPCAILWVRNKSYIENVKVHGLGLDV